MNKEDAMRDRINELKRTIKYLCNGIENVLERIDKDKSLAKLMLKELINDDRLIYK